MQSKIVTNDISKLFVFNFFTGFSCELCALQTVYAKSQTLFSLEKKKKKKKKKYKNFKMSSAAVKVGSFRVK